MKSFKLKPLLGHILGYFVAITVYTYLFHREDSLTDMLLRALFIAIIAGTIFYYSEKNWRKK